jgi:DNA repair photolyase
MKRKTGTREWSDVSVNCCRGCAHGCLYCYARANALRYGIISKGESWTKEVIRADALAVGRRHRAGRVMFPTTHDITAGNAGASLAVLISLLRAGNTVLVVSKAGPHVPKILYAAWSLARWTGRLELRVSLTCLDRSVAVFWEPGAPTPGERLDALQTTRDLGILTSVSIEPCLEPERVGQIVEAAIGAGVKGEIWIGAANKLRQRTAWCRNQPNLERAILWLESGQRPAAMKSIYKALKGNPQIRWKDSYQKVLGIDAMGRPA